MMLKGFSVIGVLLLLQLSGMTQESLTGTWLACYLQDEPGKRQLRYYRFFLRQSGNQLRGLGQTFEADIQVSQLQNAATHPKAVFGLQGFKEAGASSFRLKPFLSDNLQELPGFFAFDCTTTTAPIEEVAIRAPGLLALTNMQAASLARVELVRISDSLPLEIQSSFDKGGSGPLPFRTRKTGYRENIEGAIKPTAPAEKVIRTEEVQARLSMPEELVMLSLYDNGTIDNDTVSVLVNGHEIVSHQRLSQFPMKRLVSLNKRKDNKIVLVAHNEGLVPPNTALLIVESGPVRQQVHLGSTLSKNGVLLIRIQ